jgi:peroxidase
MRGWACLLAEKHVLGSSLGPTHIAVLRDQFKRLRDGDRFWCQNRMFALQEVAALQSTRLSDILQRQNRLTSETSSSLSLDQHPYRCG